MARNFIIPIVLLFSFCSAAQNKKIDSLIHVLPSLSGINRIDCLNELAFEYCNPFWNMSHEINLDSALKYTDLALSGAKEINYGQGIAAAWQNTGMIEIERGDYVRSEKFTRYAITHLDSNTQKAEYHRATVNLGYCQLQRGRFRDGINVLQDALIYYLYKKDTEHTAMIYRMISRCYLGLGYAYTALEYFQKDAAIEKADGDFFGKVMPPELKGYLYLLAGDTAKAVVNYRLDAKFSNQKTGTTINLLSVANLFKLLHLYDSALYYVQQNINYLQAESMDSLSKIKYLMLSSTAMAELYYLRKDYDKAISWSRAPLKFLVKTDDARNTLLLLKTIIRSYRKKNDTINALYYTRRLLNLALKTGSRMYMLDAYQILSALFQAQRQTENAYRYLLKYFELKDQVDNDNYSAKLAASDAISEIAETERKYEQQLKIAQAKNNERIARMQRDKRSVLEIFIGAVIMCLVVAAFIVQGIRLKRKKDQMQFMITEKNTQLEKKRIEQEIAELQLQKTAFEMQALRAQINPHFIFNCLSSINRYILINNTEAASDYLTKFSRLMRMALHNSEKSWISLESDIDMLRLYLDLERLRFKNAFSYTISFINTIDTSSVYIPPLLLQPFTENAIWHGLMHKEGQGSLEIALSADENNLTCTITDDGIGREKASLVSSKSVKKNKSMGVKITAGRLELLNRDNEDKTTLSIEDLINQEGEPCGTKVTLRIKYKKIVDAFE